MALPSADRLRRDVSFVELCVTKNKKRTKGSASVYATFGALLYRSWSQLKQMIHST